VIRELSTHDGYCSATFPACSVAALLLLVVVAIAPAVTRVATARTLHEVAMFDFMLCVCPHSAALIREKRTQPLRELNITLTATQIAP